LRNKDNDDGGDDDDSDDDDDDDDEDDRVGELRGECLRSLRVSLWGQTQKASEPMWTLWGVGLSFISPCWV
jgi:hypothetical protein